jgi:hypothetical protein
VNLFFKQEYFDDNVTSYSKKNSFYKALNKVKSALPSNNNKAEDLINCLAHTRNIRVDSKPQEVEDESTKSKIKSSNQAIKNETLDLVKKFYQ